jgi:hypothetical protein
MTGGISFCVNEYPDKRRNGNRPDISAPAIIRVSYLYLIVLQAKISTAEKEGD